MLEWLSAPAQNAKREGDGQAFSQSASFNSSRKLTDEAGEALKIRLLAVFGGMNQWLAALVLDPGGIAPERAVGTAKHAEHTKSERVLENAPPTHRVNVPVAPTTSPSACLAYSAV
jgi:hypothetical protein